MKLTKIIGLFIASSLALPALAEMHENKAQESAPAEEQVQREQSEVEGEGMAGTEEEQYGQEQQMEGEQEQVGMEEQEQQQQMDQQQVAETQFSSDQIKNIQQTLNDRGFHAGPVDGILGTQTKEALKNFQEEEGLEASGELNQETASALGIEAQEVQPTEQPELPAE